MIGTELLRVSVCDPAVEDVYAHRWFRSVLCFSGHGRDLEALVLGKLLQPETQ